MDDQTKLGFEANPDVPSMLALIAFVGLWGFIASVAAMFCASLGA